MANRRDHTGHDLSGAAVVVMAFVAMAGITWLDLTDGTLGVAFAIGFVLVVVTAPMAVSLGSIVTTGILPPPLMIVTLFGIAVIQPEAISIPGLADDAGAVTRTMTATLDHGLTLVIGHGLALAMIVLRNVWGARARQLSLQRA